MTIANCLIIYLELLKNGYGLERWIALIFGSPLCSYPKIDFVSYLNAFFDSLSCVLYSNLHSTLKQDKTIKNESSNLGIQFQNLIYNGNIFHDLCISICESSFIPKNSTFKDVLQISVSICFSEI